MLGHARKLLSRVRTPVRAIERRTGNVIPRKRPASGDNGFTDPTGFADKFLEPEYFYAHAEAHRRRATVVRFPRFVVHTATHYNGVGNSGIDARETFRKWLRVFEEHTWRRYGNDLPFDDSFFDAFAKTAQRSFEAQGKQRRQPIEHVDVEFVFEACNQAHSDVVVRVEAHRDHFALTLFAPLDLTKPLDRNYSDNESYFFSERNAFQELFQSIAQSFPSRTFASLRGVVSDHMCLPDQGVYPSFTTYTERNKQHPRVTELFLRSQQDALRASLFMNSHTEAIGCYLQGGQAILVTSLGSQSTRESKAPVRYLLLFDSSPPKLDDLPPQELAELEKLGPVERISDEERFRLSRLVYRINTLATQSLAALRDLRELRAISDELRRIEYQLENAAVAESHAKRDRKLMAVIQDLEGLARMHASDGLLLFYRTARAGHYFNQIKTLLNDLDVSQIPDWQTYPQFVHRRLFSTLEFVSGLGRRVMDLWEIARSRLELTESRTLLWLQYAATDASRLLFPLIAADLIHEKLDVVSLWPAIFPGLPAAARSAADALAAHLPEWLDTIIRGLPSPTLDAMNFWTLCAIAFLVWTSVLKRIARRGAAEAIVSPGSLSSGRH